MYLLGDNIKVHFNRSKGKDLVLGVEAPREMEIKRRGIYESELDKKAESGDVNAQQLSEQLKKEHAERRLGYDVRKGGKANASYCGRLSLLLKHNNNIPYGHGIKTG